MEAKFDGDATKYMESVMAEAANVDNAREGLTKIFPTHRRNCFLLPAPALETEDLVNLSEDEINKKFTARLNTLLEETLPALTKPKRQGALTLKGHAYAKLVRVCVSAMNEEIDTVTLFIPNIRAQFAAAEAEEVIILRKANDSKSNVILFLIIIQGVFAWPRSGCCEIPNFF